MTHSFPARLSAYLCDGDSLFRSAPDLSPSPMRRSPPGRSRCPGPEKLAAEAAPARAAHRTTSGGVERVGEPLHRDHFHALVAAALRRIAPRSEEHTSELQSLMRISYAVFCLKKNKIHYDLST